MSVRITVEKLSELAKANFDITANLVSGMVPLQKLGRNLVFNSLKTLNIGFFHVFERTACVPNWVSGHFSQEPMNYPEVNEPSNVNAELRAIVAL